MRKKITSYDNATVGSGSIVNECQFVYNSFSQLTTEYQSHSGAVNVSTTPKVQYGYANGSANTIRPTSLTYPNGRVITDDYSTSGSTPDAASRVDAIKDGSLALAQYAYLGQNKFVEVDYTEPDVKYTLVGTAGGNDPDTGDIYRGFDRFTRIKDSYWYNYGSAADADRIKYGYDRAGNRTYRENTVATANGKAFDELYQYDAIYRLKHMDRGTLNASKTALTNNQFAQCWSLDSTGNWSGFRQDDAGDGWWDLIQSRIANNVNEIANIAASTGPNWVTPAYSRAGHMTTIPQPSNPTAGYTATYDAWNRLVRVADGATTVAEYAYDGAKRRAVKKTYTTGVLTETRHLYYTEPAKWQVIEERVGSSAAAERQFVWGLRYIDDLMVRDRDTTGSGTLDERLYSLQDANWNVTGVVNPSGSVQERYNYAAYGAPTFLTPLFTVRGISSYSWETTYAGYRWDKETALFLVRNRIYATGLGWMQRDPLGLHAGPNLYEYASSAPISYTDPWGTQITITGPSLARLLVLVGTFLASIPVWVIATVVIIGLVAYISFQYPPWEECCCYCRYQIGEAGQYVGRMARGTCWLQNLNPNRPTGTIFCYCLSSSS